MEIIHQPLSLLNASTPTSTAALQQRFFGPRKTFSLSSRPLFQGGKWRGARGRENLSELKEEGGREGLPVCLLSQVWPNAGYISGKSWGRKDPLLFPPSLCIKFRLTQSVLGGYLSKVPNERAEDQREAREREREEHPGLGCRTPPSNCSNIKSTMVHTEYSGVLGFPRINIPCLASKYICSDAKCNQHYV